jgi:hypothetical protein
MVQGAFSGGLEDQGGASAAPGGCSRVEAFDDLERVVRRTAARRMRVTALRLQRRALKLSGFVSHARRLARSATGLLQVSSVLFTALLAACSTPGSASHDASRKELLQTLRQCLVQVSIHNGREGYQSPCAHEDVSRLDGISRTDLIEALGPAQFCTGATEGDFPEKDDCPADKNPQWSFYRLPQGVYAGGGPDLVCESDNRHRCVHVVWHAPK